VQKFHSELRKVNFPRIFEAIFGWIGIGVILFVFGKWLDHDAFSNLEIIRNPTLDATIIFLTEVLIWLILAVFAGIAIFRVWRNPGHRSKLVPAIFAVVATGIVSFVMKSMFSVPRPFEIRDDLLALVDVSAPSFPSAHTAVAFALLVPLWRISKILGILWAIFAVGIGFARVYENVHFPSDIAGGISLGGIIGAIFSHPEAQKLIHFLWKNSLEFRRQSFHFIFGFLIVFAHWAGFLRLRAIAAILAVGLAVSLVSQWRKIPILSVILQSFDRPRDRNFPGRGAFYFLAGVFLSIVLFPVEIAYASILILAVGDSINHLFVQNLGFRPIPWNPKKNWVGVGLGIAGGAAAAQFFVPVAAAIAGASVAIILETITLRVGGFFFDDNLIVPLTAGGVILFFL